MLPYQHVNLERPCRVEPRPDAEINADRGSNKKRLEQRRLVPEFRYMQVFHFPGT